MYFFEYDPQGGQVVAIHETEPTLIGKGLALAQSDAFSPGQEMEYTIYVNAVDDGRQVLSYSAIRHNPQAGRLLRETEALKAENEASKERAALLQNDQLFIMETLIEKGIIE